MTETSLTLMIREVLAEELARLKQERASGPGTVATGTREERVAIASDSDLQAFAARVAKLDPKARQDVEAGRLVFRLAGANPAPHPAANAASTENTARIDQGFLSERQVDALPRGTKRLLLGKAVRLTPLARDRLRQRGIEIERTGS